MKKLLIANGTLLLVFIFLIPAMFADVKYEIADVVNNRITTLCYRHLYLLTGFILFQFGVILYLLFRFRNYQR
ncbi:MAG TPA: hypothetical protein VK167_03890 [Flavipsychrobacter sp.]|nr:hypothetical protein [Flavipsychrobacter sp.]